MAIREITLLGFLKFGLVFSTLTIQQLHLVDRQCGKRIINHDFSGNNIDVKSKTDCAARCLTTPQCNTIMYNIKLERGEESICSLITASSTENPYVMVDDPSMCFMVTEGTSVVISSQEITTSALTAQVTTTTTISTTTPTSTSSSAPTSTSSSAPTSTSSSAPTSTSSSSSSSSSSPTSTSSSPVLSTTTTASTTETTSSFAGTIIDMINNVNNLCNANSQHDIAVVTTNGVHLYDTADSLTTGACRNMTVSDLFQGFANLPDVNTWSALMTYNNDNFDLFTNADDQVYRWQKNSGNIVSVGDYPKSKGDYIQNNVHSTMTNNFGNLQWAVYRGHGAQAMFFKESSMMRFYRNQSPKEGSLFINDTSNMDSNSRPINPWYNLPEGVVAITGQNNVDAFLVIDENLDVYLYELNNSDDFNTVPPVRILKGKLRL
ncbi:uncharacterized protein LOC125647362 [Ostrea edulis]|uniref:uncharacterized protein LOC125647362 n=1 Tax=Ostrea edulis TaxID=37623 RepID=UPI0024AEA168|nr:uncharacterized protein LOC125647362 [Ostrea edulis]